MQIEYCWLESVLMFQPTNFLKENPEATTTSTAAQILCPEGVALPVASFESDSGGAVNL